MKLAPLAFRIHRWLSWLIGVQVLLWVAGGLVFSLLPFKAWVKGGDVVQPPALKLPASWPVSALPALKAAASSAEVSAVQAVATARGPALRLKLAGQAQPLMVPVDGSAWTPPDIDAAQRFAVSMYRGKGAVRDVLRMDAVPPRLGIVDEVGGRRNLWRVRFDDGLGTRIYIDANSGEFLTARTEAWVWYDFFWRLHIMDYSGGEDFNGILLRSAAVSAATMVAAGAVLSVLALRRRLRLRGGALSRSGLAGEP